MILSHCSKLRVHPAPCVHNLADGCTYFSTCAPGVCMSFSDIVTPLYKEEHMDKLPGAQFLVPIDAPGVCTILNLNFEHCLLMRGLLLEDS